MPDEIVLGDCAAVGVDKNDNVYAFNRGYHPVAVFDKDGNLLRTWGEGVFTRPHGVHVAPDDTIWLTDDGDHTVRHCTLDGKVLLTLGIPGTAAPYMSGGPFHRCTHTALSPQGDLYVSDGYGNARVHKFAADGTLIMSWGEPGTGPGQFNLPHGVWIDRKGRVLVADRENDRVQVFDQQGKLLKIWPTKLIGPAVMYVDGDDVVYIVEHNAGLVSVLTLEGERLAQWGDPMYKSCHGVWCDSRGDLYVVRPGTSVRTRRIVKHVRRG
jgi:DNA-binding beta-propeller fold protein YncE